MSIAVTQVIQILKVDTPEEKVSPKDGSKYTIRTAQTALFDDDGVLSKVGRLRIPEAMASLVKVGTFRAGLSLDVASWGPNKGDIMAVLVDLIAVSTPLASPAPKTSPVLPVALPSASLVKPV